jgi:hypothetical protein
VKHLPRKLPGVFPPEALPARIRQALLADVRDYGIRITQSIKQLGVMDDEEWL